jgi:nucleotide-binding universal stress UspA family protein
MGLRNILIAVDSEPVAAHAADIGVELARSLGAELALIHGRGGVQRALLGSVAEGVMRRASCPVLVIRAKE